MIDNPINKVKNETFLEAIVVVRAVQVMVKIILLFTKSKARWCYQAFRILRNASVEVPWVNF